VSTTPAKNSSPVSLALAKHAFAGVNDTGKAPLNSKKIKIVTRLVYWGQKLFEEKNQR
jgi:hypothetical protein